MAIYEFIDRFQALIDSHIQAMSGLHSIDDFEREMWVKNDSSLNRLAMAKGVAL